MNGFPVALGMTVVLGMTSVFAQQSKIDSLQALLSTDKQDTAKIAHLLKLADIYSYQNPDSAILFAEQAKNIAEKIKDRKRIADALGELGWDNYVKSDYPKALDYYLKGLKINEEMLNEVNSPSEKQAAQKGIARNLSNIGNVYADQADYPKALDYYFKALKIDEELGNSAKGGSASGGKNGIAIRLGNIGIVYHDQADYPKALDYYLKAQKMYEELGLKNDIAINLGNIGIVYYDQADYPKALDYYLKALKIDEELGNKNGIAVDLGNIGSLYIKAPFLSPSGEVKKGWELAEEYLKRAIAIDDSIGAKNELMQTEKLLSQLYDTTWQAAVGSGSWQLAVEKYKLSMLHYKKAMVLKDTIFSEENKKQLIRKEMQYEYEKAQIIKAQEEKELQRQKQEAVKRRNILQYSGILIILIVMSIGIAVIPSLRGISRPMPVRFLEGVIFFTFLLFFEFLLVLLDPYIEPFTGGEPMYKLLFNAGIAALIFPLHSFFETLLKRRVLKQIKD